MWFLASTADAFLLFVVLWVAGPEGWSGLQAAAVVLALRLRRSPGARLVGGSSTAWEGGAEFSSTPSPGLRP